MNLSADSGGASVPGAVPVTVQLLFGLKSADPTALTATEAIRHLLGLGDALAGLERRQLHELVWSRREGGPGAGPRPLMAALAPALDASMSLWNPNKQRGWVRLPADEAPAGEAAPSSGASGGGVAAVELLAGGRFRAAAFGRPALDDPDRDHLLVWRRGQRAGAPGALGVLDGWSLLAWGQGELYTFQWRAGASRAERDAWTASVGVARTRTDGLLVNPHYQDHRVFAGAVPWPLWGG